MRALEEPVLRARAALCWVLVLLLSSALVRLARAPCYAPLALVPAPAAGPSPATWPIVATGRQLWEITAQGPSGAAGHLRSLHAIGPFEALFESNSFRGGDAAEPLTITDPGACGLGGLRVPTSGYLLPGSLTLRQGPTPDLLALAYRQPLNEASHVFRRAPASALGRVLGRRAGSLILALDLLAALAALWWTAGAFRRRPVRRAPE